MSMNLKVFNNEYYGDNIRWFVGIATNNKDPLRLGRIQVRIHGVHSNDVLDISNSDLPWAQVTVPGTEGGVSGFGKIPKIENGAQVFGMFMDGPSSQIPLVLGTIPRLEKAAKEEAYSSTFNNRLLNTIVKPVQNKYSTNAAIPKTTLGNPEILGESTGEKIFNFFLANGYNYDQAAAMVGNLSVESNLKTGGNGLANWSGERLKNMITYCTDNNLPIALEGQLKFIIHEFGTSYTYANGALLGAKNLKEAVRAVQEKYLKSPSNYDGRYSFARDVIERYIK